MRDDKEQRDEIRAAFEKFCENREVFSGGSPQASEFYWIIYEEGARKGYAMRVPELEQIIQEKRELESLVYVPGLWYCPKCKFNLNKAEIHAVSGNMRMRADNTPEPCPNCATQMQRVTERDANNDLYDRLEKMQIKLNDADREIIELSRIWHAASDYLLGQRNVGFANANGGLDKLWQELVQLVKAYEEGRPHEPKLGALSPSELREAARLVGTNPDAMEAGTDEHRRAMCMLVSYAMGRVALKDMRDTKDLRWDATRYRVIEGGSLDSGRILDTHGSVDSEQHEYLTTSETCRRLNEAESVAIQPAVDSELHAWFSYFNPTIQQMENEMNEIEREADDKGLNAPRVKTNMIEAMIEREYYFTAQEGMEGALLLANPDDRRPDGTSHPSLGLLTICVLVMSHGATVTGEGVCADPANFNAELGRKTARLKAIAKAWELEGYRLATERKLAALRGASANPLAEDAERFRWLHEQDPLMFARDKIDRDRGVG